MPIGGGGIHFNCQLFALAIEQPLGSQTWPLRIVAPKMKFPSTTGFYMKIPFYSTNFGTILNTGK